MEGASEARRWMGRNAEKDSLREMVWRALESQGASVGEIWGSIPDFRGASDAAERLAQLPVWKDAQVVKSNPDKSQEPVRLRALVDGKRLYMPVPQLAQELPFVRLDPVALVAKGVSFAEAASIEGALMHGERVNFSDMEQMDVLVVGCVACGRRGGRTGKGAGFADLELGIFSELGLVAPSAPIVTTVHDLQIVSDEALPLQGHDFPLDLIVTPSQVVVTEYRHVRPRGVTWSAVREDQFQDIPFLSELRTQLEVERGRLGPEVSFKGG